MLAVMASYLVHGLWLPVTGLGLWIEQVEGHKIVMPNAVPEGTFPPAVESILGKKSFRNRARVSLPSPATTTQVAAVSSHTAEVTGASKRMWRRRSNRSTTWLR